MVDNLLGAEPANYGEWSTGAGRPEAAPPSAATTSNASGDYIALISFDDMRSGPGDIRTEHNNRTNPRDPSSRPPDSAPEMPKPAPEPPLGAPIPGTAAPDCPAPKPWTPPDSGAGEYDSEFAGPLDRTTKDLARLGAWRQSDEWPDASRNLNHYLDNNGDELTQDVDRMIEECPEFSADIDKRLKNIGTIAVNDAKSRDISEPITYPLNTDWKGYYITPEENRNWYYATGGFEYSLTGSVTVYPPETEGGEYRYVTNSTVNYRDQYNWDGSKETEILGMTVTDASLAALHRGGIAREFTMTGHSTESMTTGRIR